MPEVSGRELIMALRARQPDLKALVVTGCPPSFRDGDVDWWREQPHLAKPFSVRSLQDAVVTLVGPP
jgi:FixJ family two-component response regulator